MKKLLHKNWIRPGVAAIAAATLLWIGCAAAEAKGPKRLFGLTFPEHIAGSRQEGHHDFEKRAPGLGHGVEYRAPGWKINVYIYNLKIRSIPSDLSSDEVTGQLDQAKQDIFKAQEKGIYSDVRVVSGYTLSDLAKRARLRCMSFSFNHKSSGPLDSFLCLTSWRGYFVKFRMSVASNENSEGDARQYLGAWIAHLWPKN